MEKVKQTVLTNDPSTRGWGMAVIDFDGNVLAVECIKTGKQNKVRRIRKGDDDMRRVSEINQVIKRLIEDYNVIHLLSELPHGSQNAGAAKSIGMVAAMMQTWADSKNLSIDWFSENDVKKYLFGRSSVTKQEMINKIKTIRDVPWTDTQYKDEGIADAIGIYEFALVSSSTVKILNNQERR